MGELQRNASDVSGVVEKRKRRSGRKKVVLFTRPCDRSRQQRRRVSSLFYRGRLVIAVLTSYGSHSLILRQSRRVANFVTCTLMAFHSSMVEVTRRRIACLATYLASTQISRQHIFRLALTRTGFSSRSGQHKRSLGKRSLHGSVVHPSCIHYLRISRAG